jgi:hypothetical protein
MSIWFYILIVVLIIQGLVNWVGWEVAKNNENLPRDFVIIRAIKFVFFIAFSPIVNFFWLLIVSKLLFKVVKYEQFIQIGDSENPFK